MPYRKCLVYYLISGCVEAYIIVITLGLLNSMETYAGSFPSVGYVVHAFPHVISGRLCGKACLL